MARPVLASCPEYDPSGLWTKEYAYLGTKLIAAPENPDTDGDGLRDSQDNCPTVANPDQTDTDANGIGDVCEPPTLSGFWPGGGPAGTKVWVFGAHFVPLARQTVGIHPFLTQGFHLKLTHPQMAY